MVLSLLVELEYNSLDLRLTDRQVFKVQPDPFNKRSQDWKDTNGAVMNSLRPSDREHNRSHFELWGGL
jgi:hypothetical protein